MMSSEQVEQVRKDFEVRHSFLPLERDKYDNYVADRAHCGWLGYLARAQQEHEWREEWKQAIDHELVTIGSTADSFKSPKVAIAALINWHVSIALDPKVNGGWKLVPIEPTSEMRRNSESGDSCQGVSGDMAEAATEIERMQALVAVRAIRLLVAGGFVSEAKANEAMCIAVGFANGPCLTTQAPNAVLSGRAAAQKW